MRIDRRTLLLSLCLLVVAAALLLYRTRSAKVMHIATYATPSYEADNEILDADPLVIGGPIDPGPPPQSTSWRKTPELDAYLETMDNATLYRQLNRLVYDVESRNGDEEDTPCELPTGTPCPATDHKVHIYVQPEIGLTGGPNPGQDDSGWSADAIGKSKYGLIVARIINYNAHGRQDGRFKVPARTHAWWVIYRDTSAQHALRSAIIVRERDKTPAFRITRDVTFEKCEHDPSEDNSRPALAKFQTCEQSALMAAALSPTRWRSAPPLALAGSPLRFARLAQGDDTNDTVKAIQGGDIWITCLVGCCIAK